MNYYCCLFYLLFVSNYLSGQDLELLSNNQNTFFSECNNDLWIASTSKGYNRFDGINTHYYPLDDSPSGLVGTYIQSPLYTDSNGSLWTTTYEKLCSYDKNNDVFNCKSIFDGQDTFQLGYHIFHIDSNDHLWMRAEDQLFSYDTKKREIVTQIGRTNANSFSIKGDTLIGAPWLNEKGFEIWLYDKNDWHVSRKVLSNCDHFGNIEIIKSLWDKEDLWLLSSLGLIHFNFNDPCNSIIFEDPKLKDVIANDFIYDNRQILIGTDGEGILVFDLDERLYTFPINTAWDNTDYIYKSKQGPIIYAENNSGISLIYNRDFSVGLNVINDLEKKWKKIIKKGKILLLIDSKGNLVTFESHSNQYKVIAKQSVDAIFVDDDYILFGSKYNLFLININNGRKKEIPHSWTQFQSLRIQNDKIFIKADNSLYSYDVHEDRIVNETILESHMSQIQSLGHPSGGGIPYAFDGTFVNFRSHKLDQNFDIGRYINDVVFYKKTNTLFMATNRGLYSLNVDNNIITQIDSTRTFNSLLLDKDYLFFNTESRIGQYNINSKEFNLSKRINSSSIPVFDVYNDSIYTAGDKINAFQLLDFFESGGDDLSVNHFAVNRESIHINTNSTLKLPHNKNQLSWSAGIDNWAFASLARIEYQLLPDQPNWKVVNNHSLIDLPKLTPNKYTLNIRGISSTEDKNETFSYSIVICDQWYNTWPARLIFASFIGLFFYSLFKYRMNKLKERVRVDNEIRQLEKSALQAQMNPHFIFNCLNSIQGFIMDNDKEQAMEYLGGFAQLIRSNLNASTSSKISLAEEHRILHNYLKLERLRLNKSFEYEITLPSHKDPHDIMIPPMLIQPFVENAVIHGMRNGIKNGKIEIEFNLNGSTLNVEVSDNGDSSLPPINISGHKSVGVDITRKRLNYINQSDQNIDNLRINHTSSGTTVNLSIQLD